MRTSIQRFKDGVNYTLGTMPAGMRWGRGTVQNRTPSPFGDRKPRYSLLCDCGNIYIAFGRDIVSGHTKSCGCYKQAMIKVWSTKHGYSLPTSEYYRLYKCWIHMISRCYDMNDSGYNAHGGRGITVCNEWRDNPEVFQRWAISNGYSDTLTLDRYPNNDGNYEPSNCRWATRKQQNRNTRSNRLIMAFGETKCISAWVEDSRCVVSYATLWYRLKSGMDTEDAMTKPSRRSK